jgi:hypothetical protein
MLTISLRQLRRYVKPVADIPKHVDDYVKNKQKEADRVTEEVKKNKEFDGPSGPEPTRYGDWERKGRVYDF